MENNNTHGSSLLRQYLADNNTSQAEFARLANLRPDLVCNYLLKKRNPNVTNAVRIEQATAGTVPVESWVDDEEVKQEPPDTPFAA